MWTQAVTVGFESSMLLNYLPLSNLVLLVDNDGVNWTNATIYNAAAVLNNGRVEFPGVTISNTTPYFTLASRNYIATPLPVEMVPNTLIKEGCAVTMNWTVASELNCSFYYIEKSLDGIQWNYIGEVNGSGNSSQTLHYSFTDRSIENDQTHYYRLTQVDFNGDQKSYDALSISGICLQKEIAVFPNPASNQVTIQVPEAAEMQIFDQTSRLISSHSFASGESVIQISDLSPALYILHFTLKNGESVIKSLIVK